jgi:hypothetical protein
VKQPSYDPAELEKLAEARRERELRWSQPGYRQAIEKALDKSPPPLPESLRAVEAPSAAVLLTSCVKSRSGCGRSIASKRNSQSSAPP